MNQSHPGELINVHATPGGVKLPGKKKIPSKYRTGGKKRGVWGEEEMVMI